MPADTHINFYMAISSHVTPAEIRYLIVKFHMAILSQISLDKNVLNVIHIQSDMAISSQI